MRNDFHDLILTWREWFDLKDELVGNAQDIFLNVPIRVVEWGGGGIRSEAIGLVSTLYIVGEAGHEEGVLRRVVGEEADEDGGYVVKERNLLRLSFRNIPFIIGWRERTLLLIFFCGHEACSRSGRVSK
jgi:hypothetical protein